MPLLLVLLIFGLFLAACGIESVPEDPSATPPAPTPTEPPQEPDRPTPAAAEPSPTPTAEAGDGLITINAVGDLMLERDIITLMDQNGSAYPYEAIAPLLQDADVTIGNLEGTFTERGVQAEKFYTFRTPPRHAPGLTEAGFDVVSLGNNHAMDYGDQGLADTLAALDDAGLLYSGAGPDEAEARRPAIFEAEDAVLAFLSYNAVQEATFAGPAEAGVARASVGAIEQDVTAALQTADIVVVSLHAGTEYQDAPTAQQASLARAAIDAGATIVLGHHAHVFQGWQAYGGGVIVYGLGNFVFDLDFDDLATLGPRPFQTAVVRFELTPDGAVQSVVARPVFIDPEENRPVPATGERLAETEARIRALNDSLR